MGPGGAQPVGACPGLDDLGLRQAKLFAQAADVSGIVLTKLDGTARGGIALAIARELDMPVKLIGVGESVQDLRPFDSEDFARALIAP